MPEHHIEVQRLPVHDAGDAAQPGHAAAQLPDHAVLHRHRRGQRHALLLPGARRGQPHEWQRPLQRGPRGRQHRGAERGADGPADHRPRRRRERRRELGHLRRHRREPLDHRHHAIAFADPFLVRGRSGHEQRSATAADRADQRAHRRRGAVVLARYSTENSFDGHVLEYSLDGGTTWSDILGGQGSCLPTHSLHAQRLRRAHQAFRPERARGAAGVVGDERGLRAGPPRPGRFRRADGVLPLPVRVRRVRGRRRASGSTTSRSPSTRPPASPCRPRPRPRRPWPWTPPATACISPTRPSWSPRHGATSGRRPIALTGAMTNHTGPAGPTYTIPDAPPATAPSPWAAPRAAPPPATATRWRTPRPRGRPRTGTHGRGDGHPDLDGEDVDAPRRQQLCRGAAFQPVLPLHRDAPPPRRDRGLHGDQLLPVRLHHPRADGRVRHPLEGASRLRAARVRGRRGGLQGRSRVQPVLPLDRGADAP